jgi:predicted XRE-type DNA-binding protein
LKQACGFEVNQQNIAQFSEKRRSRFSSLELYNMHAKAGRQSETPNSQTHAGVLAMPVT